MKPIIAITIGDFNGIGPEVTLKSIASSKIKKNIQPVLIGSFDIFQFFVKMFKLDLELIAVDNLSKKIKSGSVPVLTVHPATSKSIQLGKISPDSGVCAGMAIEHAIK
ncbi:MAG TPA: hypothetical protein DCQ28_05180, partial [Bacteroidetes bacterium]|nr:hypothetical protein [Bacteroidota bacterium]